MKDFKAPGEASSRPERPFNSSKHDISLKKFLYGARTMVCGDRFLQFSHHKEDKNVVTHPFANFL
jgi:hypothetical protein